MPTYFSRLLRSFTSQLYVKICKDFEEYIQKVIGNQNSGDVRSETGYVGIKNQGATCYLNSLMQALYHTAFLREAVFQIPSEVAAAAAEPAAPVPDSVVLALQRVFYRLQFSQSSVGTKVAIAPPRRPFTPAQPLLTHLCGRR